MSEAKFINTVQVGKIQNVLATKTLYLESGVLGSSDIQEVQYHYACLPLLSLRSCASHFCFGGSGFSQRRAWLLGSSSRGQRQLLSLMRLSSSRPTRRADFAWGFLSRSHWCCSDPLPSKVKILKGVRVGSRGVFDGTPTGFCLRACATSSGARASSKP